MKEIVKINFPKANYYQEVIIKSQIVIHHTVSGTARSAYEWWKTRLNGKGKVATAYIIDRDGTIYNLFPAVFWAHHIGVSNRVGLCRASIGIELVSWGKCVFDGVKYSPIDYDSVTIPEDDIFTVSYRGHNVWQKYSDEQLISLAYLLDLLTNMFAIPYQQNKNLLYSKNSTAINGERGIFTHSAYRLDKTDCVPFDDLSLVCAGK